MAKALTKLGEKDCAAVWCLVAPEEGCVLNLPLFHWLVQTFLVLLLFTVAKQNLADRK